MVILHRLHRLHRLRVGRLTLGLTVADRWECSQATGLPAWRHQDLSTSQPLRHTVSRALKHDNLYLGTGPGWTLCIGMYTATQGAFVCEYVSPRGEKLSYLSYGLLILHTQMHISCGGGGKVSKNQVNRRVNTLRTERQTTPR